MIIKPISGFNFSYVNYWFFVNEPTTINNSEMYFQLNNDNDFDITVNCTFEQIEGIDLSVNLLWNIANISVGESLKNYYSIKINSSLATTVIIHINIFQKPVDSSEQKLAIAGAVTNRVTYYTEEQGHLLRLNIFDQSDRYREAMVTIKHSYNKSAPFTIIKEFNGTDFYGLLPSGNYQIQAYDLDTGIYGEANFKLINDTDINVNLALVGFNMFRLLTTNRLGINTSINNFVGELEEVEIFGELLFNGEVISQTEKIRYSKFPKITNFYASMWFDPIKMETGEYIVRGVIYANELFIADKSMSFTYTKLPINQFKWFTDNLPLIFIGSLIIIMSGKMWLKNRKLEARLNEKNNR